MRLDTKDEAVTFSSQLFVHRLIVTELPIPCLPLVVTKEMILWLARLPSRGEIKDNYDYEIQFFTRFRQTLTRFLQGSLEAS